MLWTAVRPALSDPEAIEDGPPDVTYQTETGEREYVWATSWGVSTRMIGGIIMAHGDDQGLRLPPRLAPVQAVIVPIWRKEHQKDAVLEVAERLRAELAGQFRVKMDAREGMTPGWKFNEWELRGVPLRAPRPARPPPSRPPAPRAGRGELRWNRTS